MRDRLRGLLRHPIVQNVLALGTAQAALTVLPLITLPYLARVLDRSEFGLVVFVQTFSILVALIVEYGFNLSAPRQVATRRDDPKALADAVAGVLGAKLVLTGAALALGLAMWPLVPIFRDNPDLLGYGVVLGILQGFLPVWFFLGIERAQLIAIVEVTSRLAGLGLIVVLVRDPGDGELVLALYIASAAASVFALTFLMFKRVRPVRPTRRGSAEALRAGRTLFAGTGATAFYTGANVFLLGLIVPAAQVAVFAAAEKVVRAGNRVLGLMAAAVYPRVSLLLSRDSVRRANRLSTLSLLIFGGAALAGGGVLAIFAPVIVEVVFGPGFEDAAALLRILSLLLPLNVIGVTLSTQWLLPRGLDRQVATVVVCACALNVVLVVTAAEGLGLRAAAFALVVVEVFVVAGNALALRRADTIPQSSRARR
jgi:PST family polysaccharide transporter